MMTMVIIEIMIITITTRKTNENSDENGDGGDGGGGVGFGNYHNNNNNNTTDNDKQDRHYYQPSRSQTNVKRLPLFPQLCLPIHEPYVGYPDVLCTERHILNTLVVNWVPTETRIIPDLKKT